MATTQVAVFNNEHNNIIKQFLKDAGLFWQDTWLECLPEEILNLIYKFVNDDIIKVIIKNIEYSNFHNSLYDYYPEVDEEPYKNITLNGNIVKKVFKGVSKTKPEAVWVGEECDEFDLDWDLTGDRQLLKRIQEDLNLPVIHYGEFRRLNVSYIKIRKYSTKTLNGFMIIVDVEYMNLNQTEKYFELSWRFDFKDTIKKGVDKKPRGWLVKNDYRHEYLYPRIQHY